MIAAELKVYSVVKYVGFLFSYIGTGLFYLFCGLLILGIQIRDVDFPIGLVAGITIIVIGVLNMICGCFMSKNIKPAYVQTT